MHFVTSLILDKLKIFLLLREEIIQAQDIYIVFYMCFLIDQAKLGGLPKSSKTTEKDILLYGSITMTFKSGYFNGNFLLKVGGERKNIN